MQTLLMEKYKLNSQEAIQAMNLADEILDPKPNTYGMWLSVRQRIAEFFLYTMRKVNGIDICQEIDELNKEMGGSFCASHEFCDADQMLLDAWMNVLSYEPNPNSNCDQIMLVDSWNFAKHHGFSNLTPLGE